MVLVSRNEAQKNNFVYLKTNGQRLNIRLECKLIDAFQVNIIVRFIKLLFIAFWRINKFIR